MTHHLAVVPRFLARSFFFLGLLCAPVIAYGRDTEECPISYAIDVVEGSVSPQGDVLLSDGIKLYHLDHNGDLVRQIEKEGYRVQSFFLDHSYYWVCFARNDVITPSSSQYEHENEGRFFLSVFRGEGKRGVAEIGSFDDFYVPFFQWVQGSLYFPYRLRDVRDGWIGNLQGKEYAPLLSEVTGHEDNGAWKMETTGFELCKIHDRMLDYYFQFKKVWATRKRGSFVVMNELEPVLYFYDANTLLQEQVDGARIKTSVPFHPLNLEDYTAPPKEFWKPSTPMPTPKAKALFDAWQHSFSRITFFGEMNDGYLVAYTGKTREKPTIILQPLSRNLQKKGLRKVIPRGVALGVHQGKALVYVPEWNGQSKNCILKIGW